MAKTIEELEVDLKAVTSKLTVIDEILKANKLGRDVVMAFQCGHSGLYFPSDYVKQWGRLYGIGLGPHPVSEVLNSDYDTPISVDLSRIRSASQIMHPAEVTFAQVDLVTIPAAVFAEEAAILDKDDPYIEKRAAILLANQLKNPRGASVKALHAKYETIKGGR